MNVISVPTKLIDHARLDSSFQNKRKVSGGVLPSIDSTRSCQFIILLCQLECFSFLPRLRQPKSVEQHCNQRWSGLKSYYCQSLKRKAAAIIHVVNCKRIRLHQINGEGSEGTLLNSTTCLSPQVFLYSIRIIL